MPLQFEDKLSHGIMSQKPRYMTSVSLLLLTFADTPSYRATRLVRHNLSLVKLRWLPSITSLLITCLNTEDEDVPHDLPSHRGDAQQSVAASVLFLSPLFKNENNVFLFSVNQDFT